MALVVKNFLSVPHREKTACMSKLWRAKAACLLGCLRC